ncbi:hypothetical protein U1Q18_002259 [Sarracenia purpurea var. burkii]
MASAYVNNIEMASDNFLKSPTTLSPHSWLRPIISFSRGLLDNDLSKPSDLQVYVKDFLDFEFRLEDTVTMLPVDKLFSDGKLVQIISPSDYPKTHRRGELSDRDPCLFSPKALGCPSRRKELRWSSLWAIRGAEQKNELVLLCWDLCSERMEAFEDEALRCPSRGDHGRLCCAQRRHRRSSDAEPRIRCFSFGVLIRKSTLNNVIGSEGFSSLSSLGSCYWNRRYDAIDNNGGARNEAAIFFEDEAVGIDDGIIFDVSGVVRGTRDVRLDEINAEEAEEVDEGSNERDDGSVFTQTDDKRRRRLAITEIEEGEKEYLK